jgi:hypothetical protein
MGYLEKSASRFRKSGWMGGKDMDKFVRKLHEEKGNKGTKEGMTKAHASEHEAVKEAVEEGLLQPHGTPPSLMQDGIFWILCENPNGLNN